MRSNGLKPPASEVQQVDTLASLERVVVVVKDIQEALKGRAARAALQRCFGEVRIVAEGNQVHAEVETRADRSLFDAVGAGVYKPEKQFSS